MIKNLRSFSTLLIFCFTISFLPMSTTGQAKVQSKPYGFVLQTLLSHSVPEISVANAAKIVNDVTLLDAREQVEYDVSHLRNARFIGYDHFDASGINDLPKDRTVLIYCSVGKRSENIAEQLLKLGFTSVFNLYGGIFEWMNAGLPVYDNNNRPTRKIHAYSRLWGKFLKTGEKIY